MDIINNLNNQQEKYKNNINNINNSFKSKFFYNNNIKNKENINIKSYDDMFYEMYFKQKYFDSNIINNINIEYPNSGNIIKDISYLLSKIDIYFLHDDKFKISKFNNKNNYFVPNNENEILLYNSIDKETYQQSEFRKKMWKIEDIINNYYSKIYIEYKINISYYDDDKNNMIWILINLTNNNKLYL